MRCTRYHIRRLAAFALLTPAARVFSRIQYDQANATLLACVPPVTTSDHNPLLLELH